MMMKAGERGPQATQNKAAEEESLAAANEISAGVAVVLTVFHACFFFFFCIRHLEALLVEKIPCCFILRWVSARVVEHCATLLVARRRRHLSDVAPTPPVGSHS